MAESYITILPRHYHLGGDNHNGILSHLDKQNNQEQMDLGFTILL